MIKKGSKKGKLSNQYPRWDKQPKGQDTIIKDQDSIIIDYSLLKLSSVRLKKGKFTNYCKDVFEVHEILHTFISKFIPHFQNKTIQELKIENNHFHKIDDDKKELCYDIYQLYDNIEKREIEYYEFYQFGIEGIRIISNKKNNKYYLLFIDCHHLIYPNNKYNNKDYMNYNCCISNLNKN